MKQAMAGDGLPKFEQMFIKIVLIPIIRVFFTWNISLFLINRETKIIKKLLSKVEKEDLQKRVIIQRIFGIEEHSSDYSVNMTLEHLRITGSAIMLIISTLSEEKEFPKEITIEGVKPKENGEDEAKKFFDFMEKYNIFIKNHKKNKSKMTKKHPWFVEFNNLEWACFMFVHTFVHRRQIEKIIKALYSD